MNFPSESKLVNWFSHCSKSNRAKYDEKSHSHKSAAILRGNERTKFLVKLFWGNSLSTKDFSSKVKSEKLSLDAKAKV